MLPLLLLIGCKRPAPGTSQPAAAEPPPLTLLAPESSSWTVAEALEHLENGTRGVSDGPVDDALAISAAVRLVRLASQAPLCVPGELTDATASRLRVVRLDEEVWALGISDRRSERVLRAPVLIGPGGEVHVVADGTEEEALTLHISRDADVFPHLLISPRRVFVARLPLEPALTRQSPPGVGFGWREEEGLGYVALVATCDRGVVEVARYLWQPYELLFAGPAMDSLPDPPGGKFVLDMDGSPALIPVGGEIPEAQPAEQRPPPLRLLEDWET